MLTDFSEKRIQFLSCSLSFIEGGIGMITWRKAGTMSWGSPNSPWGRSAWRDPYKEEPLPLADDWHLSPSLQMTAILALGPPPLTSRGGKASYHCWTLPKLQICGQNSFCHCFKPLNWGVMQQSSGEQGSWKEMFRSIAGSSHSWSGAHIMSSEIKFFLLYPLVQFSSLWTLFSDKLCPPGMRQLEQWLKEFQI